VPDPGGGGAITAGQIRRRRFVFEQRIEHSVWSARNGEHPIEDYYRRCGCIYVDRVNALVAGGDWLALGFDINRTRSDAYAGAATIACSQRRSSRLAGSTSDGDGFASCFEVGSNITAN
jgi:hypothetical protein